jgi:hypothetical protein
LAAAGVAAVILPIYLDPDVEAPLDAVDFAISTEPQRHRRHISVVLRHLDVTSVVAAALLVLRRVGFADASGAWRPRRNYEAHFRDDGALVAPTASRFLGCAKSSTLRTICEPSSGDRVLPLETRIFLAACWLLWGDPVAGTSWGVGTVAREIAAECGIERGVEMRPSDALDVAREALEQAVARAA